MQPTDVKKTSNAQQTMITPTQSGPTITPQAPAPATAKPANAQAQSLQQSQQSLTDMFNTNSSGWKNPTVKQAESQMNRFVGSMQNPLDVYNKTMQDLGIGDVRSRVQELRRQVVNSENAIRGVDENVTARTSNALVSEAQRNRLVQMEQQPLMEQLQMQSGNYNVESQNLKDLTQDAQTQTGFAMEGQNQSLEALKSRLSTSQEKARQAEAKRAARVAEKHQKAQRRLQKQMFAWEKENAKRERQWERTKAQWEREDRRWAASQKADKAPSSSQLKQGAIAEIASSWKPGSDSFVSPNQWNRLLGDWNKAGYNTKDFVNQFKHLVNPVHKRRRDLKNYQGV